MDMRQMRIVHNLLFLFDQISEEIKKEAKENDIVEEKQKKLKIKLETNGNKRS